MSYDAFISYSTHDKAVADATCAFLEAAGIRCWIAPRDITPGTEWGEAIIDGINRCRVMILIFSENANNSPQIRREVERAVNKGVAIIPLRIQDIAPAHALEYFIGSVHWLDAITPPLELHLRRLAESVTTLLRTLPAPGGAGRVTPVASAAAPSAPGVAPTGAGSVGSPVRRGPRTLALAGVAVVVAATGIWWLAARPPAASVPSADTPVAGAAAPAAGRQVGGTVAQATGRVDPAVVGSFEHSAVIDGYDWRFDYTIAANGTYRLVTTQQEDGTFQGGNGTFRTVGANTGRVRTGRYWSAGGTAIAVQSAAGTATYRPLDPATRVDPAHPVMLGTWQATAVQGGLTWVMTIRNNPDGTYHYEARAQDHGSCTYANEQWRATSASTGQSDMGTYRVIDAKNVEFTGQAGSAVWQRR